MVYFGLFSVYDSAINMLLAYLHDLIYCFLNMIDMMLSAYYMYFLFYVELYEIYGVKLPFCPLHA